MRLDTLSDIDLSTDADVSIGANGDFEIATGSLAALESMLWRLKTVRGDWRLQPACGADLESFIGAPGSPEVGDQIRSNVIYALTHDGFLNISDIEVRVSPINSNELAILVSAVVASEPITIVAGLDLREGKLVTDLL
jgi:hypothetical protein